jgi:hypothetical protein
LLPKRRKAPRMAHKDETVIRCAGHLQWIRGCICLVYSDECQGNIEAAHVRTGTDGSMGKKPSDSWTVPLCHHHHAEQHRIGEAAFEAKYKTDMKHVAKSLWISSRAGQRYRTRMEQDA